VGMCCEGEDEKYEAEIVMILELHCCEWSLRKECESVIDTV